MFIRYQIDNNSHHKICFNVLRLRATWYVVEEFLILSRAGSLMFSTLQDGAESVICRIASK
ncbi:hypothetical protein AC26_3407 [Escherichia coli 1-176-05_S3_C2]|nr:hypothetical protein AC26_3407 [Escherichia coli 1-176-05_S3_C2]